jgi:hypothetical protein
MIGKLDDDEFEEGAWDQKECALTTFTYKVSGVYLSLIIHTGEEGQQPPWQVNKAKVATLYQEVKKELLSYAKGDIKSLESNPNLKDKCL